MKLIDEQGRLFGKLSIIDLVIVLAAAVLAIGFIYKRASGDVQQIVNASTSFYVTFKADWQRGFSVDALAEGDIFYEQYDGQPMGPAQRVDIEPARLIMPKADGTAVYAETEDRYAIYVTVACKGSVTETGYYINGHKKVAEGNELVIKSNRLLLPNTVVYRVAETPYEP
ncbi:MAG: DUF4330 domain-containing protein [Clostridiales bacterium]|jgi:hypothetical protein|nr:DUF4330 domain-containing protein [Clostridiales bacterium]